MKKFLPIILLFFSIISTELSAQQLFPCSPVIEDDYGVCTHITRTKFDFDIRDQELDLTQAAGISWVRSDLDFSTYFSWHGDEEYPRVFDDVLESCKNHDTQMLGIFSWLDKLPWLDEKYADRIRKLAVRYDGRITHWEALNEVNLYKEKDQLESNYLEALRTTYETLKSVNPNNQVLLSGLGEVTNDFLSNLSALGAYRYFDVMNFHSYLAPESLIPSFQRIASVMRRDGWSKPVWFTECGMHTAESGRSSAGFFTDMLPKALQRVDIREAKTCVGVLRDEDSGYNALTDDEISLYLSPYCRQVREVSFTQLADLSVRKVPVLIATRDEFFPRTAFDSLVDYVRRGGTIVLCGGMPFYYDATKEADLIYHRVETGTSLYGQLHMSPQNAWNDNVTGEKLSETPSVTRLCDDADFSYQWTFSNDSPARYLSADNLQPGDELIPLITAGTEHCQGTVAGIYKLGSDLKGNIIFQTRMYSLMLPDRELEQSRRVARIYLLAFAHGVSKVFWYNLRSREEDITYSEDCFGLIHADFSEKPSMQAYRTLVQMCPQGSTRPQLETDGALYKCQWKRPDNTTVTALWSPNKTLSYPLKHFKGKVTDHLGNPIHPKGNRLVINSAVTFLLE